MKIIDLFVLTIFLEKITKDELKHKVYASDFTRKHNVELLHLYELLNAVGIETFNIMYQKSRASYSSSKS